ncbi:MAG TPA: carboxylesterase family protein [Lachnospiraceae bacterium]|nr:carboxylesterase family protein [Lachnospiraceae bacterium]
MLRVVKTENGVVEGIEAADPRITAYKGIPFAAPPVGENRWRAPKPCKNWEGVLKAYRFAPISVQDTPGIGDMIYNREWHVDPEIPMSEDCLYLNVWTSAKKPDEKQPVVVWYFGGALQWGYPSEMEFDGERLARRGIVVVTVNYRINVFGFMSHPQITKDQPDAPGNFGNLDQQAGLKWVIRNIAAFGGDPQNITIAGQSAGGGSVLSQMTCPANFGLFQKAIIQSAMIRDPYGNGGIGKPQSLEQGEKNGENFLSFLNVSTLDEARKLDAFYIRDKYAEYAQTNLRMGPVLDNTFCVGDPLVLFAQNKRAKVPVMAGNTADEFPNFITAQSQEEFEEKAKLIFGDKAEEFIGLVETSGNTNKPFYGKVSGIECTVKAEFLQSGMHQNDEKCFYYRFDAEIPGWDNPGTFHSVELWFFFETLAKCWRPFNGKHYDLARQMCNYWSNFVKAGDPNGLDADGSPMPEWVPYTKETPYGMVFKTEGSVLEKKQEKKLESFLIQQFRNKFCEKDA